jgi:hypothetical protein
LRLRLRSLLATVVAVVACSIFFSEMDSAILWAVSSVLLTIELGVHSVSQVVSQCTERCYTDSV